MQPGRLVAAGRAAAVGRQNVVEEDAAVRAAGAYVWRRPRVRPEREARRRRKIELSQLRESKKRTWNRENKISLHISEEREIYNFLGLSTY